MSHVMRMGACGREWPRRLLFALLGAACFYVAAWPSFLSAGDPPGVSHPFHTRVLRPQTEQLQVSGGGNSQTDLEMAEGGPPRRAGVLFVPAQTVVESDGEGVPRRHKRAVLTVTVLNPDIRPHPVTGELPQYQITGLGEPFILPGNGGGAGGGYAREVTVDPGVYTITMTRMDAPAAWREVTASVFSIYLSGQLTPSLDGVVLSHPPANDYVNYVAGREEWPPTVPMMCGGFLGIVDWEKAKIKFTYDGSDPFAATDWGKQAGGESIFRLFQGVGDVPLPLGEVKGAGWAVPGEAVAAKWFFGESSSYALMALDAVDFGKGTLKVEFSPDGEVWAEDGEDARGGGL